MSESGRKTINIGTTELSYDASGAGDPVLLIHAGIADSRMWDPQMAALSERYRVIRFDQRGYGRSLPGSGLFSFHGDLLAFLDAIGVERPHIVGASFGGRIAIDFTLEHPDRVRSLTLIGSALSGSALDSAVMAEHGPAIDEAEEAGDAERAIELEMALWVDGPSRHPRRAPDHVRDLVREMQRGIYATDWDGVDFEWLDPPAAERLTELALPILAIVGDHDIPDIHAIADRIAATVPGARKVTIQDAAHLPGMEHPDEVNRVVLGFLEGVG